MNQQHSQDQVVPYPKGRRFLEAAIRSTHHKPMIHGLLEVDITKARAFLRDQKAETGEALSFSAFIISCLAQAVDEHKAVHAFRQGNRRLVLFADVDVLTWVEREVAGQPLIMPSIVRAANRKPFPRFTTRSGPPRSKTWPQPRWGAPRPCRSCRPGCFAPTFGSPPGSGDGIPGCGSRPGGR
jgi:pyruvate/2-oxoglutarate dehydrogenase complex dihydrolipoamide acyltransferase (E2) component